MKCPFCRRGATRVLDSRSAEQGRAVRRRRACRKCRRRFTTYERPGNKLVLVVKRDGTKEAFNREKLRQGLEVACNKRPVSERKVAAVLDKVEREAVRRSEIPSRAIGDMVLHELKRLDPVAYVRFASVYRSFSDVSDFIQESKAVQKNESKDTQARRNARRV